MRSLALFFWLVTILFGEEVSETDSSETIGEVEEGTDSDIVEEVVTLNATTFDAFLGENERVMVEFYAPWCGHCKQFAPIYEEAAKEINEIENITSKLAKIDATEANELATKYGVTGYPTLIFFENFGKGTVPYKQARSKQSLLQWLELHEKPAYDLYTFEQFQELRNLVANMELENDLSDYLIIGFVKKNSKRERLFDSFAEELRGETLMSFYKVYLKKKEKYRIVLLRNNRELFSNEKLDGPIELSFSGKIAPKKSDPRFSFTQIDFGTWLNQHRFPFFIDGDNYKFVNHPYAVLYNTPKVPTSGVIVIRVKNDTNEKLALKEKFIDLARDLRSNEGWMIILSSKSEENIGFTEDCDMLLLHKTIQTIPKKPSDAPQPVDDDRQSQFRDGIRDPQSNYPTDRKETIREHKYRWNKETNGEISPENLRLFLKNAIELKTHKRWYRSEPIPTEEQQKESLTNNYYMLGVANNFKELVMDPNYDVVVLYCTPWSKYCEEYLEDTFKAFGKYIQDYYKKKPIRLVYYQSEHNDVDEVLVQGFPTLILYPGGTEDKKGLMFRNDRNIDLMADFLDEFANSLDKTEL